MGVRRFGRVNWLGLGTLAAREIRRFMAVWQQTVFAPLMTAGLFVLVFALALGRDRGEVMGLPYLVFLAPGILMMTVIQNARTSGGGYVPQVPTQAATVGPVETWKAERVSIWHPGHHDNPFGMRLSALMISKRIVDTSVPMSLLADHADVHFHYYRGGLGTVETQMH